VYIRIEIMQALKGLKREKAGGLGNLSPEQLNLEGQLYTEVVHAIVPRYNIKPSSMSDSPKQFSCQKKLILRYMAVLTLAVQYV